MARRWSSVSGARLLNVPGTPPRGSFPAAADWFCARTNAARSSTIRRRVSFAWLMVCGRTVPVAASSRGQNVGRGPVLENSLRAPSRTARASSLASALAGAPGPIPGIVPVTGRFSGSSYQRSFHRRQSVRFCTAWSRASRMRLPADARLSASSCAYSARRRVSVSASKLISAGGAEGAAPPPFIRANMAFRWSSDIGARLPSVRRRRARSALIWSESVMADRPRTRIAP